MIETDIQKVFKDKKFPLFIKNNKIFKSYPTIKKIFPDIGLDNCSEQCSSYVDNNAEMCANRLLRTILENLNYRKGQLSAFEAVKSKDRKSQKDLCLNLLRNLSSQLSTVAKRKSVIKSVDGKVSLYLHQDIIVDKQVIFKSGQGLFRVYNKINEELARGKFILLPPLDSMHTFKVFSSANFAAGKMQTCFSSVGTDGLWDITTMSMRGISSCQRWDGEYRNSLVGSIVDPFTGIIYLTSGSETQHGSKMIRRCVVRFITAKKAGSKREKVLIGLENMYPDYNKNVANEFIQFIKRKTKNKYDVIYIPTSRGLGSTKIPISSIVKDLPDHNRSYIDSNVDYDDIFKTLPHRDEASLKNLFANSIMRQMKKLPNKHDCRYVLYTIIDGVSTNLYEMMESPNCDDVSKAQYVEMITKLIEDKEKLYEFIKISMQQASIKGWYGKSICQYIATAQKDLAKIAPAVAKEITPALKAFVKKHREKPVKPKKTIYSNYQ